VAVALIETSQTDVADGSSLGTWPTPFMLVE
jgi:hypothetical protein